MNNKVLIGILLVFLLAGGWYTQISAYAGNRSAYLEAMKLGNEKFEKKLYQEAITYYQSAWERKNSRPCLEQLMASYEAYYIEETGYNVRESYLALLKQAYEKEPEESAYWERAIELCLEGEDYDEALAICKEAGKKITFTEKLEELGKKVRYAYEWEGSVCPEYLESVNGYFITIEGESYGWLSNDGEHESRENYVQMSRIGEDGVYLCQTEEGEACYLDLDGVKRGVVEGDASEIMEMGTVSEGYCNVKYQDTYALIDLDGNKIGKELMFCGSMQNGYAAVQEADGSWGMLSADGTVHKVDAEEIRCDLAGKYCILDRILAKRDGVYRIFDAGLKEPVSDFACTDLDIPSADGIIAFQNQEGLWGYVDLEGNILIEPRYEQAKSFSHGLAAVCADGGWGYINRKNEIVVDCIYRDCGYVTGQGTCFVSEEKGYWRLVRFRYPDLF